MKIIIPMAGLGTRFAKVSDQNPEYKKPKPFITVKGQPMVRWATGSLPFFKHRESDHNETSPSDITFIVLKEHNEAHGLEKGLREIYPEGINVIILDEVTRGAAETVYKAKDFIDPEDDLIITDSDHYFDGEDLWNLIQQKDTDTAGIIPVFRARNEGIPKWSYSLTHPDSNHIVRVAEKDRALMEAGAYANIGAYYFSKGKHFLDLAKEVIDKNQTFGDPGKGEFYIAPLYQILLDRGHKLQAAVVPEVWGLGTPSDLEHFLENHNGEKPLY